MIRKNRLSAKLLGLAVLLFTGLFGSFDHLAEVAKTPDFLQTHAGKTCRSADF